MDGSKLYKLPWTFRNNISSWIDIYTTENRPKTISEINKELRIIETHRYCESIVLSGPNIFKHEELPAIILLVKRFNKKVFIADYENFIDANFDIIKENSKHISGLMTYLTKSSDKNIESMIEIGRFARKQKITIYFNKIVNSKTVDDIPMLVEFAEKNSDLINNLLFVGDLESDNSLDLIVSKIKNKPCAMLGGVKNIEDIKWLFINKLTIGSKLIGEMNPQQMKAIQLLYQFKNNSWAGFFSRSEMVFSKIYILVFLLQIKTMKSFFYSLLLMTNPLNLFKPIRLQSIIAVQTIACKGDQGNFCEGCPNVTVHNNKLISRCKVDLLTKKQTYMNKSIK